MSELLKLSELVKDPLGLTLIAIAIPAIAACLSASFTIYIAWRGKAADDQRPKGLDPTGARAIALSASLPKGRLVWRAQIGFVGAGDPITQTYSRSPAHLLQAR